MFPRDLAKVDDGLSRRVHTQHGVARLLLGENAELALQIHSNKIPYQQLINFDSNRTEQYESSGVRGRRSCLQLADATPENTFNNNNTLALGTDIMQSWLSESRTGFLSFPLWMFPSCWRTQMGSKAHAGNVG